MHEILNRTAYNVGLVPGTDKDGHDYAAVVVKGTFELQGGNNALNEADEQLPLIWADEYYGEPGVSSVRYEAETPLSKRGTDVVLIGHAYASGKPQTVVDVSVNVGPVRKTVRVFGDRYWEKSFFSLTHSKPEPFERIPLCYENAYGGADAKGTGFEARNPVGKGFAIKEKHLLGQPLPNLEDPKNLISSHDDRPAPAGFGYIGRGWVPRIHLAGTYDGNWQQHRAPLLPNDFDNRYFNGAHPDLVSPSFLTGGEPVEIINAWEQDLRFSLPPSNIEVKARIRGREQLHQAKLDTLLVEPDEQRVTIIWRATIPCFKAFLYLERLTVTSKG